VLWFLYESGSTRVGFTYNDTSYYYTKNAQGDVTGIVDSDYNTVVQYSYDAWGKLLSTTGSLASTIGKVNPLLYRGYYYDLETGLYYLNSRYYDAQTRRFLNPDTIGGQVGDLNSHNVFAYCENNPVSRMDSTGYSWDWFNNATNTIKGLLGSIFGASSTTVIEDDVSHEFNGGLFSIKTGTTNNTTIQNHGNSGKPISVYSNSVANKPISSTVGLKINLHKTTIQLNLGLSNIGITTNYKDGNLTSSSSLSLSLSEAKLKLINSTTQQLTKDHNVTVYGGGSANGDFAGTVFLFYASLQGVPSSPSVPVPGLNN